MWRAISSSDKKAERSEKPSSSGNSLVGDLGDLLTGGISFLNVGEVGGVGVKLEGVVGSSGEGLGAEVVGAKLEGVLGSSGKGLGARLEGVVGCSAGGISSFSEDRVMLIGVSLYSKSSLGKRSPPFGIPGIYW